MPESRALRIFYDTIGSQATKKQYDYQLKLFQKHYKLRTIESILSIEPKKLQTMIEDYVYEIKQKGLSKSYVNMAVCAIQGFTSMNDVILNFPKIKRLYRNPLSKLNFKLQN
ncbi:site-specific integrase [Candidatus Nitrosotenuis aquarius]|uniref:site-specific integrase n=1 Tax=Candidatus Nitrosotenuis aquarius TaxID=1846278 RepID=UPI000C1E84D8|nr:site-specific integrase [Candidatus Nitrosotenuis aquarius]